MGVTETSSVTSVTGIGGGVRGEVRLSDKQRHVWTRTEGALGDLMVPAHPSCSGPGWREPGPVWGDDREGDREVSAAVQRLWLLLRHRGLPLACGPDRLVSPRGRGGGGACLGDGAAEARCHVRATSPLSPCGLASDSPWWPFQVLPCPRLLLWASGETGL